ncbi:hypothetical protein BCR35DRAFT_343179 [Leucosporidium creatinivorum]|uniref:Ser-Thr-rich glycosyl-phosphatidyl-inositol-anchored membrane family-domain-containing protein n=1 Tax=Leucosporidium creatinivorum TaxID=106004 RepID=A0A1Y2EXN7_9BASI|nr:hypothetical protein BCR35DRAFT_343179 [Leucosporidium creatinivorum]
MSPQRQSRFLLALLAFAGLATPLFAESLPKSIVVAYPADGIAANSTAKEASQFSLIDQGSVGGAYLSAVNFTLTYPNGTSGYIGAVTSGGCSTTGSGNSTRGYSWTFDNSQVGDYNLKALVSLAIPVNGTCPEPADYQNSTLSFGWSFVAPSESNSGISGATTTTATFAQAPTGTYSATGTVGSTPTDTTTPASGGSRTVAGALAGLVVASLGMAVLA